MSYRKDKDLEFLKNVPSNELDMLVQVLTEDSDGKTRTTESLTGKDSYKKHSPNHHLYVDDILEELQRFGGHTLVNLARGQGVLYSEILKDVCEKQKVKYYESDSVAENETRLLETMLDTMLKDASPKQIQDIAKAFDPSLGDITLDALKKLFMQDKLYAYKLAGLVSTIILQSVTKAGFGFGMSALASVGLSKVAGMINPIAAAATTAWLVSDLMGPAYRVTIPAVVCVAFLRQRDLHRKEVMKMEEKNYQQFKEEFKKLDEELPEEKKAEVAVRVMKQLKIKLNILVVGGTGVGKSSTIAALFKGENIPEIGVGSNPQTQEISKYKISNTITLWDSPGLGESKDKDEGHRGKIISLLQEKDENGLAKIDLVLVILDASNKDLSTAYELINKVIIPNLEDKNRILVALNKCDTVVDRVEFVENGGEPSESQLEFLNKQVENIQKRIKDDTGVDVEVVYYAAGLSKEGKPKEPPYNLTKLLYHITQKTPPKKRLVYISNTNEIGGKDDKGKKYGEETKKSWWESLWEGIKDVGQFVKEGFEWVMDNKDNLKDFSKPIKDIKDIFELLKKKR